MDINISNLPSDKIKLKEIIFELKREYEKRIFILEEEIQLLKHKLFGRRTEKLTEEDLKQGLLFDEAEMSAREEDIEEIKEDKIVVKSYKRRKPGRKPLPKGLPREEIIHDIPEEEKVCLCGADMVKIGEETSEKLKYVPAKVTVEKHIRPKYACKSCEGTSCEDKPAVKIAPVPLQIIPKSITTPSLLASILIGKFEYAIPFYRQEKWFMRQGIDISRADMSNWAIQVSSKAGPLVELLLEEVLEGPVFQMDETTVQVMKEPGKADTTKSYMWVMRGGPPGRPVLLYKYHRNRSGDVALSYLENYAGYVQTDGFKGYNKLEWNPKIIHVGDWAHVRRNFNEAVKGTKKAVSIHEALGIISRLFVIEKECREKYKDKEKFNNRRKELVKPVFKKLKRWLLKKSNELPPETLLGKAVNYTLTQWPKLIRYIENSYLTPDTNLVENAIRPFVVGRKNWLFSGSPRGAYASASLYSLIETAKANKLEPYKYLCYILTEIPFCKNKEDFKQLLPQYLEKNNYNSFIF